MMECDVKKIVYKVVVSNNGFEDFESKVSEKLNQGWKTIGGIAFNYSFPYQAMAKVVDVSVETETTATTAEPPSNTKTAHRQ